MTKSLDVQTYDDGQIERLKKQSMTSKRTDYEKKKKNSEKRKTCKVYYQAETRNGKYVSNDSRTCF